MQFQIRIFLTCFLIVLFFIPFSVAIDLQTIFSSHFNSSVYTSSIQLNVSIPFNISFGNRILENNSYVCTGSLLNLTASNVSSFRPISLIVECPRLCSPYSSPSSSFPQPILWISQAEYNLNKSQYNDSKDWCEYYQSSRPPNPLALYNYTAIYRLPRQQTTGIATFGVFCFGNISFYENNSLISSPHFVNSVGVSKLSARLSIGECALMARSFEIQGPTQDCWYSNSVLNNYVFENITVLNYVVGPNLTLTPLQSQYSVTPGGSVTFSFKLNNTGDMNATISNVSISNGFTVTSFSPSTINAGQAVDFTVTATAPITQPGTTVSPTISFDFNSTVPVIGTCGSASVASVNVGSVLIGDINPIRVRIYANPSGFFNEGNIFIPSRMNVTARIWREDPLNYGLGDVYTNISIYYYNTSLNSWRLKFRADINGWSGSEEESGRYIRWFNNSDGIFINLNETISSASPFSYVPGVYRVEIRSYDPLATIGSRIQTDSAYFVIYNIPGCVRKV